MNRNIATYIIGIVVVFIILFVVFFGTNCWTTIPSGFVGVKTLWGKVQQDPLNEGFHVINPFCAIEKFDGRQKTLKEKMAVPSKDQLLTTFELSIQYRLIKTKAPSMLRETGKPNDVIEVHMIPLLRSQMREIGKSVATAEMFYDQKVQKRMQVEIISALSFLTEKGIKVDKVLIRDIVLPKIITNAVLRKKEAAQAAEKAKEELKKFKVDQERKEAQAIAEKRAEIIEANKKREVMLISANGRLDAAKIDAKAIMVRAEAEADAKKRVIKEVSLNGYIKLEGMKALKEIQNGNHLIILDSTKTNPLPFLNLNK